MASLSTKIYFVMILTRLISTKPESRYSSQFIKEYGPANVITVIIPIDEFTADNGCTQIGSNWKEFTKLENGRFILPQVQSGPAKGTVPKDISKGYSVNFLIIISFLFYMGFFVGNPLD